MFVIGVNQRVTDNNAAQFGQAAVHSASVPAAVLITRVKDTEIRGGKQQARADFHLLSRKIFIDLLMCARHGVTPWDKVRKEGVWI